MRAAAAMELAHIYTKIRKVVKWQGRRLEKFISSAAADYWLPWPVVLAIARCGNSRNIVVLRRSRQSLVKLFYSVAVRRRICLGVLQIKLQLFFLVPALRLC